MCGPTESNSFLTMETLTADNKEDEDGDGKVCDVEADTETDAVDADADVNADVDADVDVVEILSSKAADCVRSCPCAYACVYDLKE